MGKRPQVDQEPSEETKIALLQQDITYIRENVQNVVNSLDKFEEIYVTRKEFESEIGPIKKVVYGVISLILVGVVGAILSLVVKR